MEQQRIGFLGENYSNEHEAVLSFLAGQSLSMQTVPHWDAIKLYESMMNNVAKMGSIFVPVEHSVYGRDEQTHDLLSSPDFKGRIANEFFFHDQVHFMVDPSVAKQCGTIEEACKSHIVQAVGAYGDLCICSRNISSHIGEHYRVCDYIDLGGQMKGRNVHKAFLSPYRLGKKYGLVSLGDFSDRPNIMRFLHIVPNGGDDKHLPPDYVPSKTCLIVTCNPKKADAAQRVFGKFQEYGLTITRNERIPNGSFVPDKMIIEVDAYLYQAGFCAVRSSLRQHHIAQFHTLGCFPKATIPPKPQYPTATP